MTAPERIEREIMNGVIKERDELLNLIRDTIAECVSDAGSDDPKFHKPSIYLVSRWHNAIAPKEPTAP